ncbi:NUDIX domain-containing protein [uncultured Tateyamaria sp.]|uniref:NUDIX domain-containing protein n=1 Tax=uncultured Tateyamaria sp. TaxID=455651 RepID=UPI002620E0EF|nr:NUDIX domain-containing protein [uncultured Tateyamaria sp.]
MKNLFFYGSLRHVPLLEFVLGRGADQLDLSDAALADHAVLAAPGGVFPVLVPQAGAVAQGILVRGLSEADVARLRFYEGGFDYDLCQIKLISGAQAEVFMPSPTVEVTEAAWALDRWVQDWGAMSLAAADEVMAAYGVASPEEIAARFPRIRARAWSRVLAKSGRHGQGVLDGRVEIVDRRRAHTNFFGLDEIQLRHETFDGGMSEVLDRAVFISSDAAVVLPYDPVRDRVLLVEQIRLGAVGRHDSVVWQMEPVAGLVDPGERPEDAAHREAFEEAGLRFVALEPVGECYASPGSSTDFFHLYVGLCDLPDEAGGVGGEESEGENIRSHLMSFEALLELAEARKTANVPLTLLTYWLAHHRTRLRSGAQSVVG